MGPIQFSTALIQSIFYRIRRLLFIMRARLKAKGDWKREWLFTPSEFRGDLARRIVSQNMLHGLSRSELVTALTSPDISNSPPSSFSLCWYVGPRHSGALLMFPYAEYLVIQLDTTQHVLKATIHNFD